MPTTSHDVLVPSQRRLGLITIPASKGVLSTLAVIDNSNALQPNDCWIELGIMSGGTSPQNRVATLASGYSGKDTPISWSGKIILDTEMLLYAHVYSSAGGLFRLVGIVHPYKLNDEGGIILDP